jgi:hypothetical protein
MTKYTFSGKINNKKNNTFQFNNSTNYSKILDDIILTDIIKKNDYLFKKATDDYLDDIIINAKPTYDNDTFTKATYFLTNYNKLKKTYTIPFKLNTTYTLADGTPIIFYDDEIQIGFDIYKYNMFSDYSFLNALNNKTKDIIINIYTNGAKNIKINIL